MRSSWNWTAALFTSPWLASQRRYGYAAGVLLFTYGWIFALARNDYDGGFLLAAPLILTTIVFGLAGGSLEREGKGNVIARILVALLATPPLLVVLLFSLDTTHDTKAKGYRTQMVADLFSLQTAESTSFARTGRYTTRPAGFDSTYNVSWPTITLNRDSTAYSATVTHAMLRGKCGIAKGMPNPIDAKAPDGDYRCNVRR